jgi:short-subunit dehydrogenase
MNIEGKRIVVTGASSGIGKALVEELALSKAEIVIAARSKERLDVLAVTLENSPATIHVVKADISSQKGVDKLFKEALKAMKGIDVFVANAGFAYCETFDTPNWKHIDDIYSTNVISPFYSLAKMAQLNKGRKHAVMITASAVAKIPLPGYSLYCGTKAALDMFSRTYRFEQPKEQVLTMVYPVGTRTRFFDVAGGKSASYTQSAELVANKMVKALRKEKKELYPSILFQVFWKAVRIFPFVEHLFTAGESAKFRRRAQLQGK